MTTVAYPFLSDIQIQNAELISAVENGKEDLVYGQNRVASFVSPSSPARMVESLRVIIHGGERQELIDRINSVKAADSPGLN